MLNFNKYFQRYKYLFNYLDINFIFCKKIIIVLLVIKFTIIEICSNIQFMLDPIAIHIISFTNKAPKMQSDKFQLATMQADWQNLLHEKIPIIFKHFYPVPLSWWWLLLWSAQIADCTNPRCKSGISGNHALAYSTPHRHSRL